MSNLVSNALKFTDKGFIKISYQIQSNQTIEFSVKDTGIGIPEDKLEMILTGFVRPTIHIQESMAVPD